MTYKAIIFDFDGTLANTYPVLVEITNQLAPDFGYEPVTPARLAEYAQLSSQDIIRTSGVSPLQIPFLLRRVQQALSFRMTDIQPFPGILDMLLQLRQQGYHLAILTSNSRENVNQFLDQNDFDLLFDRTYSGISLLGKHRTLRRLMRRTKLDPREILYVGDETRDIQAAHQVGVAAIAVGWGFNAQEILLAQNPDGFAVTPPVLPSVIAGLPRPAAKYTPTSSPRLAGS
ncbi:MAG: HAD-IA family hydrolase [Cyanobacteria bacterium P01_H01_bin.15]